MKMRLLVVGAGSTGGYFGGRLAQAGRDVTFLVRPARAESLRRDGLRIVSPLGNVTVTPTLVTAATLDATYDVVLLAVKAYALESAMEDMAPAIGQDTLILPVLNGMKHVDMLTSRFGNTALAGCACRIAASIDDEGRIVQLSGLHEIRYGEMDGSMSDRILRLDGAMRGAGFDAYLSGTVRREMWEKWTLLATLGGINCLMRGTIGDVQRAEGGPVFMERFLREVTAVISAVGETPSEAFLDGAAKILAEPGSAMTTSMYRDMVGGQRIEADQIIGDLVVRARQAGVDTPLLVAAYTHLAVYQNRMSQA